MGWLEDRRREGERSPEMREKYRVSRLKKAALEKAVDAAGYWNFDPRTGNAYMNIRPMKGQGYLGMTCYVGWDTVEGHYRTIIRAGGRELYPPDYQDPQEALRGVEQYAQDVMSGRQAEKERQKYIKELAAAAKAIFGDDAWQKIIMHALSARNGEVDDTPESLSGLLP